MIQIPVSNIKKDPLIDNKGNRSKSNTATMKAKKISRRVGEPKELQSVRYHKDNDLNLITIYQKPLENKLFAIVLCAFQQHPEATEITIGYRVLASMLGIAHENYNAIRVACRGIMVCEKRGPNTDKEFGFDFASMFMRIVTDIRGEVTFIIQPEIKALFLKKDSVLGYMSYYLQNLENLNNTFTLRIYEILKQFQSTDTDDGWHTISYSRLVSAMMVRQKSYLIDPKVKATLNVRRLKDFERYVLERARVDIKKHTDISFTYDRTGCADGHVQYQFKIRSNKKNLIKPGLAPNAVIDAPIARQQPSLPNAEQLALDHQISERKEKLKDLFPALTAASIRSLSNITIDDSIFYDNLESINQQLASGALNPANLGGYINSAITNNHAKVNKPVNKKTVKKVKSKESEQPQEKDESNDDLIQYIKAEYDVYINKSVAQFIIDDYAAASQVMKESRFGKIKFPPFENKEEAAEYFTNKESKSKPACMIFKGKALKLLPDVFDITSFSKKELMIEIKEIEGNYILA